MPSAALAMSASGNTITGALPPSSRCTRLRSLAAAPATSMPARTEPVIETICGILCSMSRRPVARLEYDGVPRGQRGRDLPDHHHQRVVPGGHLAHHADRLAPNPGGVA